MRRKFGFFIDKRRRDSLQVSAGVFNVCSKCIRATEKLVREWFVADGRMATISCGLLS